MWTRRQEKLLGKLENTTKHKSLLFLVGEKGETTNLGISTVDYTSIKNYTYANAGYVIFKSIDPKICTGKS